MIDNINPETFEADYGDWLNSLLIPDFEAEYCIWREELNEAKGSNTMATPKLTDQQYRELNGSICPWCGTRDIKVDGTIEINDELCAETQVVNCLECNAKWYDIYPQKGFVPID